MPPNTSLAGLTKWLGRDEWRGSFEEILWLHVGPACERAGITFDDIAGILGQHAFMTLWGCAFEDFLSRDIGQDEPDQPGRNIIDDYLKRRGWKEPVTTRRYMEGLRHATMSLYEVSGIVAGESFLARDLVRGGEPVRVVERTATTTLAPWERIGARLVRLNGRILLAGGLLPFTFEASEAVLKSLKTSMKRARKELRDKTKDIAGATSIADEIQDSVFQVVSAPLFTNAWIDDALKRAMDVSLPALSNTDGDEIVFHTVRYALLPGTEPASVRARLRTIAALREESDRFWNWIAPSTTPKARPARGTKFFSRDGQTWSVTLDDGAEVLGNIELTDKAVLLMANSRERKERGQAMLAQTLEGLVRTPLVEIQTLDQAMAARGDQRLHVQEELPEELRAEIVHDTLDAHYRTTLDQPVAMLGGRTPRAAAGTKGGRQKVAKWLKYLESSSGRHRDDPMASYDFGWLWTELGMDDLRR